MESHQPNQEMKSHEGGEQKNERKMLQQTHLGLICFDDTCLAVFSNKALSLLKNNKAFAQKFIWKETPVEITFQKSEDIKKDIDTVVIGTTINIFFKQSMLRSLRENGVIDLKFKMANREIKLICMSQGVYGTRFKNMVKETFKKKVMDEAEKRSEQVNDTGAEHN